MHAERQVFSPIEVDIARAVHSRRGPTVAAVAHTAVVHTAATGWPVMVFFDSDEVWYDGVVVMYDPSEEDQPYVIFLLLRS